MNKMDFLFFIYLNTCVFQFLSCERSGDLEILEPETKFPGINVMEADLSELQDKISGDKNSLIFITTDWCKGGALTFKSYIYPYLQDTNNKDIPYYILYFGDDLRNEFISNSENYNRRLTVYKLDDSLFENAFLHKMRIGSFLSELDQDYKYSNSIPVTVKYHNSNLQNVIPSKMGMQNGD